MQGRTFARDKNTSGFVENEDLTPLINSFFTYDFLKKYDLKYVEKDLENPEQRYDIEAARSTSPNRKTHYAFSLKKNKEYLATIIAILDTPDNRFSTFSGKIIFYPKKQSSTEVSAMVFKLIQNSLINHLMSNHPNEAHLIQKMNFTHQFSHLELAYAKYDTSKIISEYEEIAASGVTETDRINFLLKTFPEANDKETIDAVISIANEMYSRGHKDDTILFLKKINAIIIPSHSPNLNLRLLVGIALKLKIEFKLNFILKMLSHSLKEKKYDQAADLLKECIAKKITQESDFFDYEYKIKNSLDECMDYAVKKQDKALVNKLVDFYSKIISSEKSSLIFNGTTAVAEFILKLNDYGFTQQGESIEQIFLTATKNLIRSEEESMEMEVSNQNEEESRNLSMESSMEFGGSNQSTPIGTPVPFYTSEKENPKPLPLLFSVNTPPPFGATPGIFNPQKKSFF